MLWPALQLVLVFWQLSWAGLRRPPLVDLSQGEA